MEKEILLILDDKSNPSLAIMDIYDKLGLETTEELAELQATLNMMVEDGTLYYSDKKKKYMLLKNSHMLSGKFIMNPKGFGFVDMGRDTKDIYIGAGNINGARNGDTVLIELIGDKTEGKIIKIVKRDISSFVGEVYMKNNKYYVDALNKDRSIDMEIPKDKLNGAVEGHKVLVKPTNGSKYVGEVVEIIGHKNDVGIDILSFVYDHDFRPYFSEEVKEELKSIPSSVSEEEMKDRLDLRDEVIFTIDGADTKDIDDAVSIKKNDDGTYELGVHIADVSHYVKDNTALGEEAYNRGTSVYLVDRVVPMLPHQLSNGICSLNENEDRLAMSCIMTIDGKGNVKHYDIRKSVIRSRKKMTYDSVNHLLEDNIIDDGYQEFASHLTLMNELSDILRKKMVNRGYIEFEDPEAKILVDENCHPYEIKLREQRTGEKLIENFMIVANETVASDIYYRGLPGIYRVHDKPDMERLQRFLDFIAARGYVVKGKRNEKMTARDLQYMLDQLKDKPESRLLNELAIRSQKKAIYSEENIGHFGLGSKCYAHFTSPIRRFPDLTLHRLIKDYNDNYSDEVIRHWEEVLPEIALHSSKKEQDSVACERDVDKMKKAEYMEDHIGEVYDGIISGVAEFGMFVELPNTVEGLVKASDIPGDYYEYDSRTMSLIGVNSKKKYTFGDEVKVKVVGASKDTMNVDFELVKEFKKNGKEKKKS